MIVCLNQETYARKSGKISDRISLIFAVNSIELTRKFQWCWAKLWTHAYKRVWNNKVRMSSSARAQLWPQVIVMFGNRGARLRCRASWTRGLRPLVSAGKTMRLIVQRLTPTGCSRMVAILRSPLCSPIASIADGQLRWKCSKIQPPRTNRQRCPTSTSALHVQVSDSAVLDREPHALLSPLNLEGQGMETKTWLQPRQQPFAAIDSKTTSSAECFLIRTRRLTWVRLIFAASRSGKTTQTCS